MSTNFTDDDGQALVIGGVAYGDRSRIVKLLTRDKGLVALWVANARNSKALWHPMAMLQASDLTRKNNQGLWNCREVSRTRPQIQLRNSPERTAVAFFVAECLGLVLQEEARSEEAFDLAWGVGAFLEGSEEVSIIPVYFMANLVRVLGLMPPPPPTNSSGFHLENGEYVDGIDEGTNVLGAGTMGALVSIPGTNFDNLRAMNLTRAQRKDLALGAFRYIRSQLGLNRELKSYEVLEALFA